MTLRELVRECGVTDARIAELAGCSRVLVTQMLGGKRGMSAKVFEATQEAVNAVIKEHEAAAESVRARWNASLYSPDLEMPAMAKGARRDG